MFAKLAPMNYFPMSREEFDSRWPCSTQTRISFHCNNFYLALGQPHFLDVVKLTPAEIKVLRNLCRLAISCKTQHHWHPTLPDFAPPMSVPLRQEHMARMRMAAQAREQDPNYRDDDPRTEWILPSQDDIDAICKSANKSRRLAISYTVICEAEKISYRPILVQNEEDCLNFNVWRLINSVNFMCNYMTSFQFPHSLTLTTFEYYTLTLVEQAAALSARLYRDVISWEDFVVKWGKYDVNAALQYIVDKWAHVEPRNYYGHWSCAQGDLRALRKLEESLSETHMSHWTAPCVTPPTQIEPSAVPPACIEQWDDSLPPGIWETPQHFRPSDHDTEITPLQPVSYKCSVESACISDGKTIIRYTPHVLQADARPADYMDLINAVNVVHDYFQTMEVIQKRNFLRDKERMALSKAKRAAYSVLFSGVAGFAD